MMSQIERNDHTNRLIIYPAEIIQAVGRERITLGLVFAGGKRDGEFIHTLSAPKRSPMGAPFGERSILSGLDITQPASRRRSEQLSLDGEQSPVSPPAPHSGVL